MTRDRVVDFYIFWPLSGGCVAGAARFWNVKGGRWQKRGRDIPLLDRNVALIDVNAVYREDFEGGNNRVPARISTNACPLPAKAKAKAIYGSVFLYIALKCILRFFGVMI